MAVQVVFALLGEEFHRPGKAFPGADGAQNLGIGGLPLQEGGLPPQLGGGMGIRMGEKGQPVQGRDPPVHGRVGGEAGLHPVNLPGKIPEAVLQPVKAGTGAKEGKMGGPDVGGHQLPLGGDLQQQLQQVPAVQLQDGPPVGVKVAAQGLQPGRQPAGLLQAGQEEQAVDLAGAAVLFVDGADLPRHQEEGVRPGGRPRQPQLGTEGVDPLPGGNQLPGKLLPPGRMGAVPGAHQADALPAGPPVQMGQVTVPAGGPGIAGMDVQIGQIHGGVSFRGMGVLSPL